jgi:hypothetical protein
MTSALGSNDDRDIIKSPRDAASADAMPLQLWNLECDKAIEEPTSKSHQGQRLVPQRKSGCTGAIFRSSRHELKAWQTGGVHVRSFQR